MNFSERFESRRDTAIYWFNKSSDLRGSSAALWCSQSDSMSDAIVDKCGLGAGFRLSVAVPNVFQMLAGMSLELAYKAALVAQRRPVPHSHALPELAVAAGLVPAESETALLRILSGAIVWLGRYPVPKSVDQYKRQSELREQWLYDREPLGERSCLLTPNHALSWDGFDDLWHTAAELFWKHYEPR